MAATHVHIATATASSSAAFLEFTAIPQTYSDLEIIFSFKYKTFASGTQAYHNTFWNVNGSTTSSVYPMIYQGMMYGAADARNATSTSTADTFFEMQTGIADHDTPTRSVCGRMMLFNYTAATTTGKSIQARWSCMRNTQTAIDRCMIAADGNLNIAAAISSIKVYAYDNNVFADGANMRLYGIDRTA